MKRVNRNFIAGKVYADIEENELIEPVYFKFIKVKKSTSYFEKISGPDRYLSLNKNIYKFPYPSEFWEISPEEEVELIQKGYINE